ncbi:MAG: hypothetical protein E7048_04835 [Lentisphaerae bacterium]|nr:hypothetical protein [Lentisphaerota bacterium]
MEEREIKILTDRLIPVPKEITFNDGEEYIIKDDCIIEACVADVYGVEEKIKEWSSLFWQASPQLSVSVCATAGKGNPDAYTVEVTQERISISASGLNGVMNAMKTLRQLAEVQRGTERVTEYFLVPCSIKDEPALAFRGIHLCIFPETPLWDIERQIRIAAYHKFNYAVIECWGIFPFDSHPEMCWADKKLDKGELKALIRLGQELGITLIPQFNLLGHAAAGRIITGKHAILSYSPELQPLFEPEGWTWCLTNPETRRILTDLVMELYEFFDYPPFFHIGCDEADNIGTCRECRKRELKTLVKEHICYFRDLFAKVGTKVIMWHDMLLQQGDERWKGYIVCGLPEHQLSELYKELPKDIIIADWQYGYPKENPEDPEPEWPTAKFFKGEEFSVIVCPWLNQNGITSLGKLAGEEKLFGMLETTWHISHDRNFITIFCTAAYAAWNPAVNPGVTMASRLSLAHHVRQLGWDTGVDEYCKTGWNQYQVDPGHHPHSLL